MKKAINDIREFLWPMLDPALPESVPIVNKVIVEEDNLKTALELVKEISTEEDDRRKTVESKASLFLGSISVASSIVVAASAWVTGSQPITLITKWSIVGGFILAVYAARTVWFSIHALQRGSYHELDYNQINVSGNANEYLRNMIKVIHTNTVNNYAVINEKVDYLVMAQLYYKRAIVTICLYAAMIVVFSFIPRNFSSKVKTNTIQPQTSVNIQIDTIHPKNNKTTKPIIDSVKH